MIIGEMKEMLRDEYRETFARAESYGRISDLEEEYLEDCLADLGDLLYTAQEKGTPVEKLIGSNPEAFCRSYFSAFTVKDRVKHVCGTFFKDTWGLLVINLLLLVGDGLGGVDLWTIPTNWYTGWFLAFDVSFILFYNVLFSSVLRRVYFRIRHGEMIQTVGTICLVLLSLFLGQRFRDVLSEVPALLVVILSGGYILLYLLVVGHSNYRRTGHLFDPERKQRRSAR
ncbi:MAG: hypothetical protein LUF00_06050 [Lachnospiraceae bacterium]|nr:hypothetical protein [Lachnospiraceae bacterium]